MPATYVAVCHFDLPRRPLTRVHRRAVSMQPTTACRIDSLACSPRPLVHSSSTAAAAAAGSTSVGSTGAAAAAGSGVAWRGRPVICLPVNFKRDYALHRGASPGVLACVRAWRPDRTAGRSPDSRCRPSVGWSVVSPCWSLGVNYCGVESTTILRASRVLRLHRAAADDAELQPSSSARRRYKAPADSISAVIVPLTH